MVGFFFRDFKGLHLFPPMESQWAHAPSAVTGPLGDGCPLSAGNDLPYVSSGQTAYRGAKPGLRAAAFHSHSAAERGSRKPSCPLQCAVDLTKGLGDQEGLLS